MNSTNPTTKQDAIAADIALLHRLAAGIQGRLVLASFAEDPFTGQKLKPIIESFAVGDVISMTARAQELAQQPHRNIYFPLCVMRPDLPRGKKGSEDDVVAVIGITMDFDAKDDPRAHDYNERLPADPTMVVRTSSNPEPSYQCRLIFTHPIDPYRAKRIAKAVQRIAGCDTCSVDQSHVWRIVGGLNCPTLKKVRDDGRPVEPQLVVEEAPFDKVRLIDPSTLDSLIIPETEDNAPIEKSDAIKQRDLNMLKTVTLAQLDSWDVSKELKEIIHEGSLVNRPKKQDNSRSAWLFHAVCALLKAGVPDDSVLAIILDPTYNISKSVRDKGSRAFSYAERQVDRAKAEIGDPHLAELNAVHAVIENYGSKTVVFTFEDGKPPFHRSFEDFRKSYDHRKIETRGKGGKAAVIGLGSWWLDHPRRRQYLRVEFLPGRETPEGILNLYRGAIVQPKSGDCSKFLEFIKTVMCRNDSEISEWLLNYLAHLFQRPWEPPEVCIVLRGRRGVGKNFFVERVGEIISDYFMVISNPKHLVGSFNRHLMDKLIVFADEAFYGKNKAHAGILKNLVTQSEMAVEPKGVDVFMAKKYFRLIMASNEEYVVPADIDDRRYLVIDVDSSFAKNHAYFKGIAAEWSSGGGEAFYDFLLKRDISDFNYRKRPETEALFEQKLHSLVGAERVVYEMLNTGQAWIGAHQSDRCFIATGQVQKLYERRGQDVSTKAIADEIGLFALQGGSTRESVEGKQYRGIWVPELAVCREIWAAAKRMKLEWPDDDGVWANDRFISPF